MTPEEIAECSGEETECQVGDWTAYSKVVRAETLVARSQCSSDDYCQALALSGGEIYLFSSLIYRVEF